MEYLQRHVTTELLLYFDKVLRDIARDTIDAGTYV